MVASSARVPRGQRASPYRPLYFHRKELGMSCKGERNQPRFEAAADSIDSLFFRRFFKHLLPPFAKFARRSVRLRLALAALSGNRFAGQLTGGTSTVRLFLR